VTAVRDETKTGIAGFKPLPLNTLLNKYYHNTNCEINPVPDCTQTSEL
jgi:hypothetical protein